jgi:hypothetical protein
MRWLAVAALVAAAPAWADEPTDDTGTPSTVRATLTGTTAHVSAQIGFDVEGAGVQLGALFIAPPATSVITGGSAIVDGKRHRLHLEDAGAASKHFEALTARPYEGGERAWAFELSGGPGNVTLDVLAPKAAHLVLELALEQPTCFYRDTRYIELPAGWAKHLAAGGHTVVEGAAAAELEAACDVASSSSDVRWIGFPVHHLAGQRVGDARIGTVAGRLPLEGIQFARIELDLARQLADVPRDLHTAIVIDHSRSMKPSELEAQRAIVAAYLRQAPLGHVQVIAYARKPEPLLAGWTIASHAAPSVDRAIRALAPRNGSNLDAALLEADAWLARVDGTKRILLFSDERLAERLSSVEPASLARLVPHGVLVHVVRPLDGGDTIDRDDDGLLAPLAAATQGIEVTGGIGDGGERAATILVRPTSLDHLAISAPGWEAMQADVEGHGCSTQLDEGLSCTWWGQANAAADTIVIDGLLWNTPFRRIVHADVAQARTLARTLSVAQVLDGDLQEQVDRIAMAVNAVWSLFAQWGGSGGYEDLGGMGTLGMGRFGSSSHDGISDTVGFTEGHIALDLRRQLQPALDGCHAGATRLDVTVETTAEEIVEVGVDAPTPALDTCVTEALWDTTLRIPNAPLHATTALHSATAASRAPRRSAWLAWSSACFARVHGIPASRAGRDPAARVQAALPARRRR